jgi:hypothetical protein
MRLLDLARHAACALLACAGVSAQGQGTAPPDRWTFSVTPYLWLPNINGTLAFTPPNGGGAPEVGVGPHDWLQDLSGLLMVSAEARKGRWALLTDLIYLDFSNQTGRVKSVDFGIGPGGRVPVAADANLDTQSDLRGGLWTLAAAYRTLEGSDTWVDVFGGVRYFGLKASVDWQLAASVTLPGSTRTLAASGSTSQREDLWDAIVGVRGRLRLGAGRWFVPYSLDVGTGSSQLTYQAVAGIGYAYGWGDLQLSYRHFAVDMSDSKLLQNMRLSGPAFAATLRF